jgi:hypothetical protein
MGNKVVVKLLLEEGAELETKSSYGLTPLSYAARYRHKAMVKLLLEKGAKLETKDDDGWTPLSLVTEKWYEDDGCLFCVTDVENTEADDDRYVIGRLGRACQECKTRGVRVCSDLLTCF